MAGRRAIGRDVHFYNFAEPDKALGCLILNPSVTKKTFLPMLGILIVTSDTICITDEPCITRIISQSSTGRDSTFRAQVRERDGKCVITGTINSRADRDNWSSFHAAHIFPLSSEEYFVQSGFPRATRGLTHARMACLCGPICMSNLMDFRTQTMDWRILDPVCRDPSDNRRIRDELLRWHFRQAVLANMREAGEPTFETDFPPGTDMMGEILSGPTAAKRMEAELFSRLGGYSSPGTFQSL
ncbi:hypothetical protein V1515DRAFT_641098 [Lipomyces mesembrius]